jgi:hypothetical protein
MDCWNVQRRCFDDLQHQLFPCLVLSVQYIFTATPRSGGKAVVTVSSAPKATFKGLTPATPVRGPGTPQPACELWLAGWVAGWVAGWLAGLAG